MIRSELLQALARDNPDLRAEEIEQVVDIFFDEISSRLVEGGRVDYVHVLFDQHEIISANGLLSESFLPGPEITNIFAEETLAEITTLFPELDAVTGEGYGPPARRVLKGFEAAALKGRAA